MSPVNMYNVQQSSHTGIMQLRTNIVFVLKEKKKMQEFHRRMDYIISCQFGMFAIGVVEM